MNPLSTKESLKSGFSIVELMVAMTVLLLILALIFSLTKGTADIWKNSTGKTEGFRDARAAFESMTREISQATLTTYFDYTDSSGAFRVANAAFTPAKYMRRSDLHFICGKSLLASATGVKNPTTQSIFFQSPVGYTTTPAYANMENFLNACGFYVSYGPDPAKPAYLSNLPERYRFRLMQFTQPSENLMIYDNSLTGGSTLPNGKVATNPNWDNTKWFVSPLTPLAPNAIPSSMISQLGENVVALVILPKYSNADAVATPLSPDYEYNSRNRSNALTLHQLPPVVQVVMVIIDEASALRLGNSSTPPDLGMASLFQDSTKLTQDLATMEKNLGALPGNVAGNTIPLRYEIFQTEVSIRGAKWSNQ